LFENYPHPEGLSKEYSVLPNFILVKDMELNELMTSIDKFINIIYNKNKDSQLSSRQYNSYQSYAGLYFLAWKDYMDFKLAKKKELTDSYYQAIPCLTTADWIQFIQKIKRTFMTELNLTNFDSILPKLVDDFNHILEDTNPNERYNYLEFAVFMLYLLFGEPKRITLPRKQLAASSMTPQCITKIAELNIWSAPASPAASSASPKKHPYELLRDSLINGCSILNEGFPEIKMIRDNVRQSLKNNYYYMIPENAWTLPTDYTQDIFDVERGSELARLFKMFIDNEPRPNYIPKPFWIYYFNITYKDEAGIFLGVQQEFFQVCLKQLITWEIFIPTEEGSARYMIHRDWDMKKYLNPILESYSLDYNKKLLMKFFYFVGGLLCRSFQMGLQLPFRLSFYTMSRLYNRPQGESDIEKSISPFELYYFLDSPSSASPLFKLMSYDPSELPYYEMEFNDYLPLKDIPKPIEATQAMQTTKAINKNKKKEAIGKINTAKDILEYINLYSKYILRTGISNQAIPKKLETAGRTSIFITNETEKDKQLQKTLKQNRKIYQDLLNAFINGFYIKVNAFHEDEVSAIHILDRLLNNDEIEWTETAKQNYAKLLEDFKQLIVVHTVNIQALSMRSSFYATTIKDFQSTVGNDFKEVLTNPLDANFPWDEIQAMLPEKNLFTTEESKLQYYYREFMPKLLDFWNSNRSFQKDKYYNIIFNINDPRNTNSSKQFDYNSILKDLQLFPTAHTCFTQLEIPTFNCGELTDDQKNKLKDLIGKYNNIPDQIENVDAKEEGYADILDYFNSDLHMFEKDFYIPALMKKLVFGMYNTKGFQLVGGGARGASKRAKKISKTKKR
jgi:hypothetical protein